jgi:hypothetical protein
MSQTSPVNSKKRIDGKTKYEKICVYCTKEVTYFHGRKPQQCPHCGADNYIKPPTETDLFLLQSKYHKTKDQKYLEKMFIILKSYAASIIKKNLPKDFVYHYDKLDEKAQDAASLFIEYYLVHDNFVVEKSFGGYLQWKVKEVLWNKKAQREEDHESLNSTFMSDDSHSKELLDVTTFAHITPLYGTVEDHTIDKTTDQNDLVEGIMNIIEQSMIQLYKLYSKTQALLILNAICLTMEGKTDLYMDKYYHQFGSFLKEDVDLVKLLIYRFIKEGD